MNEFVFASSYRDLSRECCVSIICLLVQFSFKSTTETSECNAALTPAQLVAGNKHHIARSKLRAT